MSVDYGDVRTGLAVCDKNEILASPVSVITEIDAEKLAEKIVAFSKEYRAESFVVGLPRNMDGSEGFRAEACKNFASLLSERSGLEVNLYDERLTTVSAHNALNATNTRGKKRKAIVDAVSAVMILEDYMAFRKRNK
jgi:putative Holliday junction resolvase